MNTRLCAWHRSLVSMVGPIGSCDPPPQAARLANVGEKSGLWFLKSKYNDFIGGVAEIALCN